jgi:Ni/Co efflux regulator RcnB
MADQPEPEEGAVEEDSASDSEADRVRVRRILRMFTPETVEALLELTAKKVGDDSQKMANLKEVAQDFKGDFVNFTLKDTVYADMVKDAPEFTHEFRAAEVAPLRRTAPKDAAEVKAMDENLTVISKNLQLAIRYLCSLLRRIYDELDPEITDGIFCSLCLTAHSFSALQVERHTTAALRGKISDAATGSQVPSVVKKAKTFFRGGGGGREPSPSDEDDSDDVLRKKKRPPEKQRRWSTGRNLPIQYRMAQYGPTKFYQWQPRGGGRGRGRGRGYRRGEPPT